MPWSNQPGGPWSSGPRGPWGSGPQQQGPRPPDLEEILRRSQDKLRNFLPGNFGGRGVALIALAVVALWGFSGFFRVEPDELGVVLRFGKFVREVQPGLNYHLPYPIETALTPPALRVNKIDIGFDTRTRDVPEESLMLTGDQNIVDVEFSVLWLVKPNSVGDFLFNVANPASTVKAVAESAMSEVIGRSDVQPLLVGFQQTAENAAQGGPVAAPIGGTVAPGGQAAAPTGTTAAQGVLTEVQDLMQKTLDSYHAGILVQSVQLQKIQAPAEVIDSFRDVQAASSDLIRLQNEAQTYANRVVPEARGRAAKILQDAEAYRSQVVANAKGQSSRFLQVYDQYKKAPDVTRQRMYLDTMERILAGTDKTIIDTGNHGPGVVPYLPLTALGKTPPASTTSPTAPTAPDTDTGSTPTGGKP
jgi:modulator of FtsH protease HflK